MGKAANDGSKGRTVLSARAYTEEAKLGRYQVLECGGKKGQGRLQHDEIEDDPHLPYTNCFSDVFAPIPTAYVRRSRLFQLAWVAVGLRRKKLIQEVLTGSAVYSSPKSFSSWTDVAMVLCVFFLNPNLYSAARTTWHRGGHVCKDALRTKGGQVTAKQEHDALICYNTNPRY